MLYVGSCRYMYDYDWDYFAPRLHTTKEIIHFLENINTLNTVLDNNPTDLAYQIFGGVTNSFVIDDFKRFTNTPINKDINKIILEISSRKIYYYNSIPLNWYYIHYETNSLHLIPKYDLKYVCIGDEEIENDIKYIIKLCKSIFNENIEVHIIPHLNLKTKSTLEYIPERNKLVKLLEDLSNKYNIKIHNIGKYLETYNNNIFLDEYMSDSTHYSKDYDKVKLFLKNNIIGL
jgi:hypothetical protein